MHLALEAIGLGPGDEVITTPYTFAATAEVVRYFDAKPVFVDIRSDDLNLDPALIEAAITPQTRAIIPVHIGGLPADMDAISAIAADSGLAVIEDAAHAFPARYRKRTIGSPLAPLVPGSHLVCFSFYATKTLTTGEGGMITTDDKDLAERCRIMALHGMSRDAWERYMSRGSWYYEIIAPGYKYNMTDLAAAMGIVQLGKAASMRQRRAAIAERYSRAFTAVPELQAPHHRLDCEHAWHLYMLRLCLDRMRIDRDQFVEELKGRNIGCSVHFIPLHLHPYYRQTYAFQPEDLPVASGQYQREISLPIYSTMTEDDVQDVVDAVLDIVELYRRPG
jgi:dTDP-4-amino-4,6-dideoxygalactose transaminase